MAHMDDSLIARADRIAEMVVGLVEPTKSLLQERVRRAGTIQEIFSQQQWLTAEEINMLQQRPPRNPSLPASDWKRRGQIFSVSYGGRQYYPTYQFDALTEPLSVVREVLTAFGPVADPWKLAAWFNFPNGHL